MFFARFQCRPGRDRVAHKPSVLTLVVPLLNKMDTDCHGIRVVEEKMSKGLRNKADKQGNVHTGEI